MKWGRRRLLLSLLLLLQSLWLLGYWNIQLRTLFHDDSTTQVLQCRTEWLKSVPSDDLRRHPVGQPYKRKGCDPIQRIACTGPPTGRRALVLYMLQTKDVRAMQPEMRNFNYFARFGVYGPNQSTALFERVDYVFLRMVPPQLPQVSKVTLVAEEANVRLVWVPNGPCDLCAHSRVIEYLGGAKAVGEAYQYVVYGNAGARGPFQHADDAHWIDVFAMGGRTHWDSDSPTFKATMAGTTLSIQVRAHMPSMFVGIDTVLLSQLVPFLNCCQVTKHDCEQRCEVGSGHGWLQHGGALHSLSFNFTMRAFEDYPQLFRVALFTAQSVTSFNERVDACHGIFVKQGGNHERTIRPETAAQGSHLDLFQVESRELEGRLVLKRLLQQTNFLVSVNEKG